jgi:ribonuclease P protein subunit RPR2
MGKEKPLKSGSGGAGVPQKHLHSRLSFLHQAALHLATAQNCSKDQKANDASVGITNASANSPEHRSCNDSTRLITHVRGVSRKAQIRLSRELKRSICKRCDGLLLPGATSNESVVNLSKGGRKAAADVLEIRCQRCGTVKRFPVGQMELELGKPETGPGVC